jgi:hypothetical protein
MPTEKLVRPFSFQETGFCRKNLIATRNYGVVGDIPTQSGSELLPATGRWSNPTNAISGALTLTQHQRKVTDKVLKWSLSRDLTHLRSDSFINDLSHLNAGRPFAINLPHFSNNQQHTTQQQPTNQPQMKTLITTLSLVATITLANAERLKANYTPVVEIGAVNPWAKLDAWRSYQKNRNAASHARSAETKAEAKQQEENKPAPITAQSLFAAKMAERHGTK